MNATTTSPVSRRSALEVMANRFNLEPRKLLDILKNTVFKGANDEQMAALVVVSNEYGLNPLTREIYAFPAKGGGIQPVVSIDGWIRLMNSHPHFDGLDTAFAGKDRELACTVTIYKKGCQRPVVITEYLGECYRKTEPWDTWPRRMLRHKAIIQCARVAFGFSGISDEEDVGRATVTLESPAYVGRPNFLPAAPSPAPLRDEEAVNTGPVASQEPAPSAIDPESPGPVVTAAHAELEAFLDENNVPFGALQSVAAKSGFFGTDWDSYSGLGDVPEKVVSRLLRNKAGLLMQLQAQQPV